MELYMFLKSEQKKNKADSLGKFPYVIVRTYSAGVFAGYLEKEQEKK